MNVRLLVFFIAMGISRRVLGAGIDFTGLPSGFLGGAIVCGVIIGIIVVVMLVYFSDSGVSRKVEDDQTQKPLPEAQDKVGDLLAGGSVNSRAKEELKRVFNREVDKKVNKTAEEIKANAKRGRT